MAYNSPKFYRKQENKMLSGVFSGLADYAGINPNILRAGWVAITLLFTILGIAGYITLMLMLPKDSHIRR